MKLLNFRLLFSVYWNLHLFTTVSRSFCTYYFSANNIRTYIDNNLCCRNSYIFFRNLYSNTSLQLLYIPFHQWNNCYSRPGRDAEFQSHKLGLLGHYSWENISYIRNVAMYIVYVFVSRMCMFYTEIINLGFFFSESFVDFRSRPVGFGWFIASEAVLQYLLNIIIRVRMYFSPCLY